MKKLTAFQQYFQKTTLQPGKDLSWVKENSVCEQSKNRSTALDLMSDANSDVVDKEANSRIAAAGNNNNTTTNNATTKEPLNVEPQ
jgi:hypothetical protein